ncbi:MAG TPA: hypothetical protein VKV17_17815 [Bryobacteraceae bacterium]|nr:hypothetical protein [Bryobacteraceae bacterium]
MLKKVLIVKVESVTVPFTGLLPGEQPKPAADGQPKRNALAATLLYPRSGAPSVATVMPLDLRPQTALRRDLGDFFDSGLFKEEVQGETILEIEITESDVHSALEKALIQVFTTLLSTGLGVATGQLPQILGAVTNLGCGAITDSIKKAGDDQKQSIGKSDKIRLRMDAITETPVRMALGLTAPEKIERSYFEGGVQKTLTIEKGAPNGEIVLEVSAVPA